MIQVYIADALPDVRVALRLLVRDLKMNVIGEASNWETALAEAPLTAMEMLLVDWGLLPKNPVAALTQLRNACPKAIVVVLISQFEPNDQAARSAGADHFISKGETPDRVSEHLRTAAARIRAGFLQPH